MISFVVTTLPDEATAKRVVQQLVENKSAACGTIIPGALSIYSWKNAIEESAEVVVIFKIPKEAAQDFESKLSALHPYETPEIVTFEAERINQAYASWVLKTCEAMR